MPSHMTHVLLNTYKMAKRFDKVNSENDSSCINSTELLFYGVAGNLGRIVLPILYFFAFSSLKLLSIYLFNYIFVTKNTYDKYIRKIHT